MVTVTGWGVDLINIAILYTSIRLWINEWSPENDRKRPNGCCDIQVGELPALYTNMLLAANGWFISCYIYIYTYISYEHRAVIYFCPKSGIQNPPLPVVGGWITHLKNMLVKLDHFPKDRDENKRSEWNHRLWPKLLILGMVIPPLIGNSLSWVYKPLLYWVGTGTYSNNIPLCLFAPRWRKSSRPWAIPPMALKIQAGCTEMKYTAQWEITSYI